MKITTLEQLTDAIERVADELQNVDLSDYLTKAEASDTFLTKTEYEEGGNLTDYLSKSEASRAYLAKTAWQPFGTSDLSSDGTEGYVPAPPATPTYKVLTNLGWKSLESDVPIVIDAVPIQQEALTYDGTAKTPKWLYYNPLELKIGGVYQNQINAGTYNASFTPVSDVKWSNGTQDALNAPWTINKAACPATLSNTTSNVNVGSTSTFTVNRPGDGVITATSNNTEIATVEVNGTNILVTGQALGTAIITINVAEGTNHLAADALTYVATVQKMPLNLSATITGNVPYNGTGIISIQGNLGGGAVTAISSDPNAIAITNTTTTNVTVKCLENTLQVVPVVIEVAETAQYMSGTCTCNITTTLKQGELRLSAYSGTASYGTPVSFVITSNTSGGALSVSAENEDFATASLKGSTVTVTALNCSAPTQTITVTSAATDLFAETTAHFTVVMEKVTPTLTLSTYEVALNSDTTSAVVTAITNSAGTITAWADNSLVCDVHVFENNIQVDMNIRGTTTVTVKVSATAVSDEFTKTFTVTAEREAGANLLIHDITLEQLAACIKSGNAPGTILTGDYFDVTFTKGLILFTDANKNNYSIPANSTWMAICIGINHNPEYEGTNRVHFAIMQSHSDTTKYTAFTMRRYNQTATNVGGWASSNLRSYINSSFFDILPEDLQAVISPCTKYTDNVGNKTDSEENVTATTDNIFVPSLYEIAANEVSSNQNSYEHFKQAPYEYATWAEHPDGKVTYQRHDFYSGVGAWTRSVNKNYADRVMGVRGGVITLTAQSTLGFIPCFTIA